MRNRNSVPVILIMVIAAAVSGCSIMPLKLPGSDSEASGPVSTMSETMPVLDEDVLADPDSDTVVYEELPSPYDVKAGEILSRKLLRKDDVVDSFFWQSGISDAVFERMEGKSYGEGCNLRDQLRYLQILHFDFDGKVRVGELVCNEQISDDLLYIFRQLYDYQYPIEKVLLIDEYDADDWLSSSDNNTSCFNYRNTTYGTGLSKHARGLAIDVNPLYNPYITADNGSCVPPLGIPYMDRTRDFEHKIDETDICCQLFLEAGFTWGGSWASTPDYMHFEKVK